MELTTRIDSKSKKSKKKKVVKEKSVINAEELVDGIEGDSPSNNGEDGTQPEHEDTNTVATLPESTHSRNPSKIANGTHHDISDDLQDLSIMEPANSLPNGESTPTPTTASQHDTSAKIDALAKDRIALRDEVALLRKSLEELQGKHDEELSNLRSELEETQGEKEHADTQYRNLLGRVNTIKSQLGERLKSDAVGLQ